MPERGCEHVDSNATEKTKGDLLIWLNSDIMMCSLDSFAILRISLKSERLSAWMLVLD